jgi:hypothetical protein
MLLKKHLPQLVAVVALAVCALFASACSEKVPSNASDDAGEGKDEFPMGEEPTGESPEEK